MAENRFMRLLLLFALSAFIAHADPAAAASSESVNAMFSSMGMEKAWDASLAAMESALESQLGARSAGATPSPDQQQRLDTAMAGAWSLMRSELSWQAFGPEVSQIYANVFTQEEIDAMNAFYASPAGRAVMTKAPALVGTMMQGGADLTHNDVLTPEEAAAFDAFMHGPAAQSMKAKAPLVRERMAQISQANRERMRPQMQQIIRDLSEPPSVGSH